MKRDSVVTLVGLPPLSRSLISPAARWILASCLLLSGAACGSTVSENVRPTGLQRIEGAINFARENRTYRLHGAVTTDGRGGPRDDPMVTWEGIVVDGDEQYTIHTFGMLIESRRIHGASWARQL